METRDILSGAKSFHKIYNQVIQTAAAQHHLSLMDADIILFLYNNPDYDTAKDISYFRMLAKSGVSASVESRTSLGYLESHEDTADRRKIHLKLTDSAAPVARDLKRTQEDFFERLNRGISEEERQMFSDLLKRMMDNLKQT